MSLVDHNEKGSAPTEPFPDLNRGPRSAMVQTPERAAIEIGRTKKDSRLSRVFKSLLKIGVRHVYPLLPLGAPVPALPIRKVGMGLRPLAVLPLSAASSSELGVMA